jgi:hypothetical protein
MGGSKTFTPALGYPWLTPLYDAAIARGHMASQIRRANRSPRLSDDKRPRQHVSVYLRRAFTKNNVLRSHDGSISIMPENRTFNPAKGGVPVEP